MSRHCPKIAQSERFSVLPQSNLHCHRTIAWFGGFYLECSHHQVQKPQQGTKGVPLLDHIRVDTLGKTATNLVSPRLLPKISLKGTKSKDVHT